MNLDCSLIVCSLISCCKLACVFGESKLCARRNSIVICVVIVYVCRPRFLADWEKSGWLMAG